MAPPPLPPDYTGTGGGGWAPAAVSQAPPPMAPPSNDDDDWGWNSGTGQDSNAGRYANAPADDPWSQSVAMPPPAAPPSDNYNQASKDPFDPFDQPATNSSLTTSEPQPQPQTALTNQVTCSVKSQKSLVILF